MKNLNAMTMALIFKNQTSLLSMLEKGIVNEGG